MRWQQQASWETLSSFCWTGLRNGIRLRIALWTFLIVNLVPAIVLALVGPKIDPQFRMAATLTSYVVSFLFWFSLHYAWRSGDRNAVAES
jgi:hypothetical protein